MARLRLTSGTVSVRLGRPALGDLLVAADDRPLQSCVALAAPTTAASTGHRPLRLRLVRGEQARDVALAVEA
jgi:hypothetical protein